MARDLATAVRALKKMTPEAVDAAAQLISDLVSIKHQIEARARSLGYSEKCRQAIGVCGGECCRWHFPKTLTRIDFFMAVFNLEACERTALEEQVQSAGDEFYHCPLLQKNGCIFGFENRPVACTNAFPCLVGQEYWQYKERFKNDIETIRAALDSLIDQHVAVI